MIDCNELIERKSLEESYQQEETCEAKKGKKERKTGVKTFHTLLVTPPVHVCTTVALDCGNLPHQSEAIKLLFPTYYTTH